MHDRFTILALNSDSLQQSGSALVTSLYGPVTILLRGELGAGKTTFTQGLAKGLRINQHITSPTFALEQRYRGTPWDLLHIDLYRLNASQAKRLLAESAHWPGIRCIEWPEKAEIIDQAVPCITVDIAEEKAGRRVAIAYKDTALPTDAEIERWREDTHLSPHIISHCEAVTGLALQIADSLIQRGQPVRREALKQAARVHDLLRFLDFRPGASPDAFSPSAEDQRIWSTWKTRYPNLKHEPACAQFLREQGYPVVAAIVEPHGLRLPSPERARIEQKILFYADKRVRESTVVTLEERFEDFRKRYGKGENGSDGEMWYRESVQIERELLPHNRQGIN